MTDSTLVVLQENSGKVPLPPNVPPQLEALIYNVVDSLAETFEDIKSSLQASGKYDHVVLLTDAACTRKRLLLTLVHHSKRNRNIDLLILGHGTNETLMLHNDKRLEGGKDGNIRSLLKDARKMGCDTFNLRLVFMCNCYASTLNDDWKKIGARASIGSIRNDYMPEPMTTFFMHNWLSGKSARKSAKEAYKASIPFFTPIYPPTVTPKFKKQKVKYPCGMTGIPPKIKYCTKTVKVPDGATYKQNQMIKDSRLVVQGNAWF